MDRARQIRAMDELEISDEVKMGALLLMNVYGADWYTRIDTDLLQVCSNFDCPLAQVAQTSYVDAVNEVGVSGVDLRTVEAGPQFGFVASPTNTYYSLEDDWAELVNHLQGLSE